MGLPYRLLSMRTAGGVTVLGVVVLATACSTSHPSDQPTVTFRVHLGLYGGPPRPDGGMADSNASQPDTPIVLTADGGKKLTHQTNANGVATFDVRPGRYMIDSPTCGSGPRSVVIRSVGTPQENLRCDIP